MAKDITFANREVCNLIVCDFATQKPILNIDYANATSNEITGDSVYAYGGQGHPRRVTFYGEKAGTFTISTQIMTAKLFALMTGAEIENTAKFIKRLELTAGTGGALTVPEGTNFVAGSLNVFEADDDMGELVDATISGSNITVADASQGDKFIVYGIEQIATGVQKMSVKGSTFPKACTIYGETLMKGEDDKLYPYRMVVYKASPQQTFNFDFSNSGDPTTLELNFDLLADQDDNMIDMLLMDAGE